MEYYKLIALLKYKSMWGKESILDNAHQNVQNTEYMNRGSC